MWVEAGTGLSLVMGTQVRAAETHWLLQSGETKGGPRGGPSYLVLPRAQELCLADFSAHTQLTTCKADGVL